MKKYLNLFLISLLVWGCNPKNVEPAGQFEISSNQDKVLNNITIQVIMAQDSRCNIPDAVCIWGGNATAKIIVKSNSSSQKQEIAFCTGSCAEANLKDSKVATFTIDSKKYTLTLIEILRANNGTVRLKIE